MKIILGVMIAAQLLTVPGVAGVTYSQEPKHAETNAQNGEEITRVEEFKWYYRTYNGHCQMRLWSLTYGYWVTDWIDCDA